jgi:hypothetical protein
MTSSISKISLIDNQVTHQSINGVRYSVMGALLLEHINGSMKRHRFHISDQINGNVITPGDFTLLDKSTPEAYSAAIIASCIAKLQSIAAAWDAELSRPRIVKEISDASNVQTEFTGDELGIG